MKTKIITSLIAIAVASTFAKTQEPIFLKKDGGWCWFQDERVITIGNKLFFSTVSTPSGDINLSSWNTETNKTQHYTIAPNFNSDDHAAPALLELPDQTILTCFSTHGYNAKNKKDEHKLFFSRTKNKADITEWVDVKEIPLKQICYNNLFMLEDSTIYDFFRYKDGPGYMISKDNGKTFDFGGRLFQFKADKNDPKRTGMDGARPYVKYTSNNKDTIHFLTTETHPRGYDNSIYIGHLKNKEIFDSYGKKIADLTEGEKTPVRLDKFTKIFAGDADNVAWTIDMHLDENENPVCMFSVQKDCGYLRKLHNHQCFDIRYYYARFDGKSWHVNEIAYGGTSLLTGDNDYSGLGSINPQDVNTVYISTNSNPETGKVLVSTSDGKRHFEIFKGVTDNMGKTWKWTAITENSKFDNLRPLVPIVKDKSQINGTPVIWTRGSLPSFCNFKLDVVSILDK